MTRENITRYIKKTPTIIENIMKRKRMLNEVSSTVLLYIIYL